MGKGEVRTEFWWGTLREGDHLEDPSVDEKVIIKWIFEKWDVRHGMDLSGSGYRQVAGFANSVLNFRVP